MKSENALLLATLMASLGRNIDWNPDSVITEKSNLPRKEKLPLTEEEQELLSSLIGKDKKKFIKQLKEKYEN